MTGTLKKGAALLVVLFIGWYLFTDPSGLATLSKELGSKGWDGLVTLFKAIASFIGAIGS